MTIRDRVCTIRTIGLIGGALLWLIGGAVQVMASAGCTAMNGTISADVNVCTQISGTGFVAGDVIRISYVTNNDGRRLVLTRNNVDIFRQASNITYVVPSDTPDTLKGFFESCGLGSIDTAAVSCTAAATPTVTSINPTSGPAAGGTSVAITGTRFTGTTAVKFGATAATSFIVNSDTSITAVSPTGTGTVDVTVTTPGGTSAASAADQFTYNAVASSVTLTSSQNPSTFGQPVTFTATVTGSSPSGTVTFRDGATVLGTATLSGGQASLTTSSLSVGSHSITAAYSGDAANAPNTSAPLNQVVGVPVDSLKLQALQVAVTRLVAQGSGSATAGAIDNAIAEGFDDNGQLIAGSDGGLRVNLAAEPERRSAVEDRVGDAFAAVGYARRDKAPVFKAPVRAPPKEWLAWIDVRGTVWNTNVQAGDIRGGQVNALAGLTRRITPDFLVGVLGGYESFDYTSQLLNGRLKGDGWTAGGYLGWRLLPGLRFDAGVAHSAVNYDGQAGTASGTFPGKRWLLTSGLTGTYKTAPGFVIEPSAKVYALWEREDAYADSLGIVHAERKFSTGRASVGAKVAYPWLWSAETVVSPYVGIYGDYYFNRDDVVPLGAPNLLPTEYVHGLSARVTSGLELAVRNGARFSLGSEVGGLGNDFRVWSVKGRAAVPF